MQSYRSGNTVPKKVPEKVWEALVQSQVKFNRLPEKVWEGLVRSQDRFNGFRRRFRRRFRSGRFWCRAKTSPTGFRRRFRRRSGRLWCSQVRVNRVPEKAGRLWCKARSGSTGFRRRFQEALVQSQVRFNRICGHLIHGNPAEVFPGFAARFRKICKNKTLRLLGIPPKLIWI